MDAQATLQISVLMEVAKGLAAHRKKTLARSAVVEAAQLYLRFRYGKHVPREEIIRKLDEIYTKN